jgi:glycosyltransferase involved in cell wall biosynthesis/predicted nucleotide-binding protein
MHAWSEPESPQRPRAAATRLSPVESAPTLVVHAPLVVYDGYGSVAEHLVIGLSRLGIDVRVEPTLLDRRGLSLEVLRLLDTDSAVPDGTPHLVFGPPSTLVTQLRSRGPVIINTMWEASLLPSSWPDILNSVSAAIVPTQFVASVFAASGVSVPTYVVPEGVEPAIYSYRPRPTRNTFTTLVVGYMNRRKRGDLALRSWSAAFQGAHDARLLFKARWGLGIDRSNSDPRVISSGSNERTRGIAHWYHRADVILAIGSEGFGLPLVEGMATGLAAIALASEGQKDTCDAATPHLLAIRPASWEVCDDTDYGVAGVRGVPDMDDLVVALRQLYSDRNAATEMGSRAAAWVRSERDIGSKARAVLDVVDRHAPGWRDAASTSRRIAPLQSSPRVRKPALPRSPDYYLRASPIEVPTWPTITSARIPGPDPKAVAVAYGRDRQRRAAMFELLRALGLRPVDFAKALEQTGLATPGIGAVVEELLSTVQAAIVLLTPDDEGRIRTHLATSDDSRDETELRARPRQNVVFEAGLAFAWLPSSTLIVECGKVRRWTDIDGLHVVRTSGRPGSEWRSDLRGRLERAGCDVEVSDEDWLGAGQALDRDPDAST